MHQLAIVQKGQTSRRPCIHSCVVNVVLSRGQYAVAGRLLVILSQDLSSGKGHADGHICVLVCQCVRVCIIAFSRQSGCHAGTKVGSVVGGVCVCEHAALIVTEQRQTSNTMSTGGRADANPKGSEVQWRPHRIAGGREGGGSDEGSRQLVFPLVRSLVKGSPVMIRFGRFVFNPSVISHGIKSRSVGQRVNSPFDAVRGRLVDSCIQTIIILIQTTDAAGIGLSRLLKRRNFQSSFCFFQNSFSLPRGPPPPHQHSSTTNAHSFVHICVVCALLLTDRDGIAIRDLN